VTGDKRHHTVLAVISAALKCEDVGLAQSENEVAGDFVLLWLWQWLKFSIAPKNGLQCGAKQQLAAESAASKHRKR
jgi:hypothetical protein